MTKIRLRFVQAFVDRHGRPRYYFRRRGVERISLPGIPGSKAFMEAYQEALDGAPKRIIQESEPGTFDALIVAYYGSAEYRTLAEITRKTYRNDIERWRRDYGKTHVAHLQPKHIRAMQDKLADKPGAAYSQRRIIRILMRFALERNWRQDNPSIGIKKVKGKSGGFVAWTEDDIAAFEAKWPPGSRARLALALLLHTAQRRADVVRMGRSHVKGARIHVKQAKSLFTTELWIPIHPKLAEALRSAPVGPATFLITQEGNPFTPAGFTNWFVECAKEAGLTGRTPHGLRKAAAVRLAEAQCTDKQIMAITGHKNLSEVSHYTHAANQTRLADQAVKALQEAEAEAADVKPDDEV